MRSQRRASAVLAACVVALITVQTAGSAPAGAEPAAGSAAAAARTGAAAAPPTPAAAGRLGSPVTLVTGDTVTVETLPSGQQVPHVRFAPRDAGVEPFANVRQDGADLYVVPSDAADLVAAGELDMQLFNVSYLSSHGYAQAGGTLPVVLQFDASVAALAAPAETRKLPGVTPLHNLETLRAVGARLTSSAAGRFWDELVDPVGAAAGSAPAGADIDLARPVARVWLDQPVRATLEASVPHIGAPEAWAAGYDGAGVKVAVLDTGIDAGHPDLAGRIAATANFSTDPSAVDGHGHGTHVASTIVGSGAASGGRYKGVAQGASLLVGKVLSNAGTGTSSAIIDGMEWAVAQGARVVNMSLGTSTPSDGSDPLSVAADRLTAASGTLFVVAAGNLSRVAGRVAGPGAAPSTLTVGATGRTEDTVFAFSSAGPVTGSHALKPEIAAPGAEIVAARAAGSGFTPVTNEFYAALSGTSMATPHVAGAAALLAQRFPAWRAAQLKPALTSTAVEMHESVYYHGAGRLDAGRALRQSVYAGTATVDFGLTEAAGQAPASRAVRYVNTGSAPVTLSLTTSLSTQEGGATPAGAVALGAESVTVPAGGTAEVPVTLASAMLPDGTFTGAVRATAADGTMVTVPVGAVKDTSKVPVTIRVVDFAGQPAAEPYIVEARRIDARAFVQDRYSPAIGAARLRLAPGTYSISMAFAQATNGPDGEVGVVNMIKPEVTVPPGGTEVVLDFRETRPFAVRTPEPSESFQASFGYHRTTLDGLEISRGFLGIAYPYQNFWINPSSRVTQGGLRFWYESWRGRPPAALAVTSPTRLSLDARYPLYYPHAGYPRLGERERLGIVWGGTGAPADLSGVDVRGRLVLLRLEDTATYGQLNERLAALAQAGAAGVLGSIAGTRLGLLRPEHGQPSYPLPTLSLPAGQADQLRTLLARRPGTVDVRTSDVTPYLYRLSFRAADRIPVPTFSVREHDLATVEENVHADAPGLTYLGATPDSNVFGGIALVQTPLRHPSQSRVRVFYPVSKTEVWWRSATINFNGTVWGSTDIFGDRRSYVAHWGEQPATPGVPAATPGLAGRRGVPVGLGREGNWLYPHMGWTSTDPRARWRFLAGDDVGPWEMKLYRDGQEIPIERSSYPVYPVRFPVPAEPGRYRLTYHAATPEWTGPGGREVDAEWTFGSAAPTADRIPTGYFTCVVRDVTSENIGACQAEQILFLRYDLGLGLDNHVTAGRPHPIEVTAYHQPTVGRPVPRIAGLRLSVSFDRGGHWQDVRTLPTGGGRFVALVNHPRLDRTSGTASLRAEAWDAAGNRILLTTLDAYRLK